jgi:hypothetical protein
VGTWGAGIFDSDVACDARGELRDLVGDGVKDPVKRVLARYADALADPDDGPVVLPAIAAAAWDLGRLDPKLRARALVSIRRADLAPWGELAPERGKALAALERKLGRAQPRPRKIAKRVREETQLEVGDLVALELPSGAWVALVVFDLDENKSGRSPIVDVLDWVGKSRPTPDALRGKKARGSWYRDAPHWLRHALCVWGLDSRRHVIATNVPRPDASHLGPPVGLYAYTRLSELEGTLAAWFKLKLPRRRATRRPRRA